MAKSKPKEEKPKKEKVKETPKPQPTLEEVNEEKLKLAREDVKARNPGFLFPDEKLDKGKK